MDLPLPLRIPLRNCTAETKFGRIASNMVCIYRSEVATTTIVLTYKRLQLVNQLHCECFSAVYIPMVQLVNFCGSINAVFMAIRGFGVVSFSTYFLVPFAFIGNTVFMLAFYPQAGSVAETVQIVLKQRKLNADLKDDLRYEKLIQTCQPFGISVGRLYILKKSTFMALVEMVIDQTVSLLLNTSQLQ